MNSMTLLAISMVTSLGVMAPTHSTCLNALRNFAVRSAQLSPPTLPPSLPSACRKMGPISLGESYGNVIKALGPPDLASKFGGNAHIDATIAAVFVFPRNLATQLREHPVQDFNFALRTGLLVVTVAQSTKLVVAVAEGSDAATQVIPFAVGGIHIGQSAAKITQTIKGYYVWDRWHDQLSMTSGLPIYIYINRITHSVNGILIANGVTHVWPVSIDAFALGARRSVVTGKVVGFRVHLQR